VPFVEIDSHLKGEGRKHFGSNLESELLRGEERGFQNLRIVTSFGVVKQRYDFGQ